MKKPIAVLGAGSWGTALAISLANNGQAVHLWGHDSHEMKAMQQSGINARYLPDISLPSSLKIFSDLSEAIKNLDDLLLVVPSHAFREILQQLKAKTVNKVRLAWATKGLDPETGGLLSEVVNEIFGADTPQAVLSGPSFAKEVAKGLPTAVSLASNNKEFARDLIERFHSLNFRVYENNDLVGVQLCGTVKNVLAIATGISDGLQLGANARSALITRGLAEMSRLCVALGGKAATVLSLAGVGDLVLTCTDNQSRNRRLGLALAEGKTAASAIADIAQVVEGYTNAQQVIHLAQQLKIEMPICQQVYKILYENAPLSSAINELLSRLPGEEM
ncbi:MAG TPA: NAD(P)H-dependent glycerol-3-phosphate dehydrogenase [Coxiellaceae bacterium]|nr:NAD(P)H-dependent glycerol-3-phosphate dehydrogenase [Coxiellaceae bacterium]